MPGSPGRCSSGLKPAGRRLPECRSDQNASLWGSLKGDEGLHIGILYISYIIILSKISKELATENAENCRRELDCTLEYGGAISRLNI